MIMFVFPVLQERSGRFQGRAEWRQRKGHVSVWHFRPRYLFSVQKGSITSLYSYNKHVIMYFVSFLLWFAVFDDIINAIAKIAGEFDQLTLSPCVIDTMWWMCSAGSSMVHRWKWDSWRPLDRREHICVISSSEWVHVFVAVGASASDLVLQCTPEGIRLQCYMNYYTEEMKTVWKHKYGFIKGFIWLQLVQDSDIYFHSWQSTLPAVKTFFV